MTSEWAGPQAEPKIQLESLRTKIRVEIKALNTQEKISDLEPTQTRCMLEIFH
jgi:hypothetical protein